MRLVNSMNSNILYIGEEDEISDEIISYLIKNEYNISWAKNKKDALFKFEYYKPKIIISDIELEEKSILPFLEDLNNRMKQTKLIIVSNNFEKENLLKSIELNVLSYIEKDENAKRKLLTVFKRNNISNKFENTINKYKLGNGFSYCKDTKELYDKHDESIKINNQERLIIETLLKNSNNYVPYSKILNDISKNKDVSIYTLRTIIRHIRKKTYKDIIKNLSGHGYKLSLETFNMVYKSKINEKKIKNNSILLIENDIKLNNSLTKQLEMLGITSQSAFTYKNACEMISKNKYDYLVLDLVLVDKEGIELIKSIKALTNTKIIVLTDFLDVQLKESLYFLGILDYIEKNKSIEYLAYTLYRTMINIEYNSTLNEILVLDSSKYMCDDINKLLKPRGYELTFKYKIDDVLSLLEKRKFDLMVLDLDLIKDDLFQTVGFIKEVYKELPIILLSSVKNPSTIRDCLKIGASEVLSKPLLAEEFILKVDFWVDYHRKIHQLKQNQLLLNEYKLIVDKASIISKTDPNGVITYVNETFCKISGYSKEELIGKKHSMIKHKDMPLHTFDDLWDCIKIKKHIWHGRIKNSKKDGTPYFVDSYIMPIVDINDEIMEFIALRNFISEKEFKVGFP